MDLEALVTDELREEVAGYTLEWFDVEASSRRPPHATVGVRTPDGRGGHRLVHRRRPGRRDLPRDQRRHRQRRAAARVPRRRGHRRPGRARRDLGRARGRRRHRLGPGRLDRHPRGRRPGVRARAVERAPRGACGADAGRRRRSPEERRRRVSAPVAGRPVARGPLSSRREPEPLPVGGGEHPVARLGVHEVGAHRSPRTRRSARPPDVGAAPAQRQRLERHRRARDRPDDVEHAARCRRGSRSGSGTARACRGRPARRRGWSGSRRRRRRTRGRRSRPARTATARCTRPAPPSATVASGAPGLPNTTRLPLPRSTAATRRRPSKRAPERSMRLRRRLRSSRGPGSAPQHRRAQQRAAGGGEPERERGERGAGRERPRAGAPRGVQRRRREPVTGSVPASSPSSRCAMYGRPARRLARDQVRGDDRTRRRCRRSTRSRAGRSRSRPRSRRARPSSTPRRGRRRRRARGRPGGDHRAEASGDVGPPASAGGPPGARRSPRPGAVRDNVRLYDGSRRPPRRRLERSGARVSALREAMDLSLRDLAERSGVSAPMLSPGRARRDQPDAAGRQADRRRPRAAALAAAAARRGRRGHDRPRATSAARGPAACAATATRS